jgi:signal peptidase I
MIWKGLIFYTGSESPVVVVLSGSMEPAFYRGDILFLSQDPGPFVIGDIVVFKIKGKDIPIVHRVHEIHSRLREDGEEEVELLTKGDNNAVHDSWGIYNPGQQWLHRDDIMGRAVGFLPYFGMITIWLTDYPVIKYLLLGTMGIFVIFAKDQ